MCTDGYPFSPQITKKNGFRLEGGAVLASAVPTRRGPSGVLATRGPPLSPEQTLALTVRRLTLCLIRRAANPMRLPASQIAQTGSGQKRAETLVAVSRPIFCLPMISGFRLPKPASDSGAPAWV